MFKITGTIGRTVSLLALCMALAAAVYAAVPAETQGPAGNEPIRLSKTALSGVDLPAMPMIASDFVEPIKPAVSNHGQMVRQGDFVTLLFEAVGAGVTRFTDFPGDEFVYVLGGSVELRSDNGRNQVFRAGDSFVVPKGWRGEWHVSKYFRELVVLSAEGWGEAHAGGYRPTGIKHYAPALLVDSDLLTLEHSERLRRLNSALPLTGPQHTNNAKSCSARSSKARCFAQPFASELAVTTVVGKKGARGKYNDLASDALVIVKEGAVTLKSGSAEPQTFTAGESFILPKSYSGKDRFAQDSSLIVIQKNG